MSAVPSEIKDAADEGGELETVSVGALEALTKGEISTQIATAKQYPRSVTAFRREVLELATLDAETAMSCFYKLKRKEADGSTKVIEGPSARFAEIVASSWGNSRSGARVIDIGAEFVTAQGFFFDLEKNVAVTMEVQRRIVGKSGKRYGADMIGVTSMAACAIAHRNAVFKVVPKALWKPMMDKANAAARGDERTLGDRRVALFEALKKHGVDAQRACSSVGVAGPNDIGIEELFNLAATLQGVIDGDQTAEEAFPPVGAQQQHATTDAGGTSAKDRAAAAAAKAASEAASGNQGGAKK